MEDESLGVRMGMFFMVLGFGSFFLFVTSDIANKPEFDYLFIAMLLIGIGWLLRRKKPRPPSAGRFSMFRKKRSNKGDDSQQGKK
jgi:hypothetical protein